MCSTFSINGVYCENIGEFRDVVGVKIFDQVFETNNPPPPIDIECLCSVDCERMRELYDEIYPPEHADFAFVDKAKKDNP